MVTTTVVLSEEIARSIEMTYGNSKEILSMVYHSQTDIQMERIN